MVTELQVFVLVRVTLNASPVQITCTGTSTRTGVNENAAQITVANNMSKLTQYETSVKKVSQRKTPGTNVMFPLVCSLSFGNILYNSGRSRMVMIMIFIMW